MSGNSAFARLAALVARRPLVPIAVVAVLAIAGAALALRLQPSSGTDTLVSSSSQTARDTAAFKQDFGDDAVVVLVKGNRADALQRLLYTADLGRLLRLEGCLSGNVPTRGLKRLPGVCREIKRLHPARVVFGPATFINTAVNRINDEISRRTGAAKQESDRAAKAAQQLSARRGDPLATQQRLAAAARSVVEGQLTQQVLQLGLRYGLTSLPSLGNPDFIDTLVFGPPKTGSVGVPKSRFAYLFPSARSALVQIRLRPDLSDAQRTHAIALIRKATDADAFRLREGSRYVVTGVPVVSDGLEQVVRRGIVGLLIAALIVMAATLALVFRTRLRLLPLVLAVAAAAMTFGVLYLAGGGITMATVAVVPVLIGLAVDYAIQFQARVEEARVRERAGPREAVALAAGSGGPTIATAAIATAAGFLVLLLSPVPLVRGFGALVVLGIVLALICAMTAGFAVLGRIDTRPREIEQGGRRRPLAAAREWVAASAPWRALAGRYAALRLFAIERGELAIAHAVARPGRVLVVGLTVAILGWGLDTQATVVSDVRELVPANLQALRDVDTLQRESGIAGEIDVTVRSKDITKPAVIAWMSKFQSGVLRSGGYRDGDRCVGQRDPPDLCPALSLPTLLRTVNARDQKQVNALLDAVPSYFSQGVVTRDRRTANLAFGVRVSSLSDQQRLIDGIQNRIDSSRPPPGVDAAVVGFPVLAAQANTALSSPWRRALTLLAALAAVFLVLFAVRRKLRDAVVPLIPIALASGWSAAVLFILGLLPEPLKVQLNPMSVTLGALVIAITTEFSVLLSARYRQERAAGASPARAVELTYASTGAAVIASGATATAGFAVLIVSDIRMLRDFGILTVVDLIVSLLGVLVVLPAALVWSEQRGPLRIRMRRPTLRRAGPLEPSRDV